MINGEQKRTDFVQALATFAYHQWTMVKKSRISHAMRTKETATIKRLCKLAFPELTKDQLNELIENIQERLD